MTSRAVRIREPGSSEVLEIVDVSTPDPGRGELLVEVRAAGLNRADLLQRRGFYPAPPGFPPDIPGLEYAGHVSRIGAGVTGFRVGDAVMGITGGGAMATHLVVHDREAMRVPANLAITSAAAIPEVFLTAFDALVTQARVGPGDTVLIHAVASGVGTAATQICRLAGARSIGTSRTAAKLERCREWGLDVGIAVPEGQFAQVVKAAAPAGVDVVLDCIGAAYLEQNIDVLAKRGRLVIIGLMGGSAGELPLGAMLSKRLEIRGTTLRARPLEEKATLAASFSRACLPHFDSGRLAPVVDTVLPMARIREAHELMERNDNVGKIVMVW